MKSHNLKSWARTTLALAACVSALVTTSRGQDQPPARSIVQTVGLPGIDRGLRANERPVEPAERGANGLRAQIQAVNGTPTS
jgi:hypothetical protein